MRALRRLPRSLIHVALIATASAAALDARTAHACLWMTLEQHQLDQNEASLDMTAPERPRVTGVVVSRSYGPRNEGCGDHSGSSCDGSGSIGIELAAGLDDRTPPERIGYRIEHIGGELPSGLELPGVVRPHGGFIWMRYSDPGPADQPAIDVRFQLFAVDLAGNESIGSDPVRAADDGAEGCAITRARGGFGTVLFGLTALALLLRSRSRGDRAIRS